LERETTPATEDRSPDAWTARRRVVQPPGSGTGVAAASDDDPPTLLNYSRQPTFVAPQAAICWSANLQPQIKSSFKMGVLIGRDLGESFQQAFHGPTSADIPPSEGQPVVATSCVKD